MLFKKLSLFIFLLCALSATHAQKLTGTWEGVLDNDEFIQINIIQTGNKVCGYTYDYTLRDKGSFCRAYFSGEYDKVNKTWFLNGTSFMQNSGSHVLMMLKFKIFNTDGGNIMSGFCQAKSDFLSPAGSSSPMRLRKVSNMPAMITKTMRDCVAENNPPEPHMPKSPPVIKKPVVPLPQKKVVVPQKKPVVPQKKIIVPQKKVAVPPVKKTLPVPPPKKIILPPAAPKKPPVIIKPAPAKKKDTIAPAPIKLIPKPIPLPQETSGRKNKEIGRLVVNDKILTLNVYDNGTVDGDTVSVFYNGRRILDRKKLTEKPITLDLILDENTTLHSVVLFAHNLGSIPPNTALVVLTTPSRQRFELFSSATLQQNAEIVFEYKPKE